jgi:low affinity Fe/Cu permease
VRQATAPRHQKARYSAVMSIAESFTRFAKAIARASGLPLTFGLAVLVILTWALTGPLFRFSDTWQLVINTGTTIVTFLMVFLIQNTQNRDSVAMQIKLDELLRAVKGAHTALADLEDLTEEELEEFKAHYVRLAGEAKAHLQRSGDRLPASGDGQPGPPVPPSPPRQRR